MCMTAHPQIQRRRAHCLCKPIFAIETKLLIGCKDYLFFQGMCWDNIGPLNARTSRLYLSLFSDWWFCVHGAAAWILLVSVGCFAIALMQKYCLTKSVKTVLLFVWQNCFFRCLFDKTALADKNSVNHINVGASPLKSIASPLASRSLLQWMPLSQLIVSRRIIFLMSSWAGSNGLPLFFYSKIGCPHSLRQGFPKEVGNNP